MTDYLLGIDYGSDSVRALLVDANSGEEVASAVSSYKRWQEGMYCDTSKNQFRQHPLDYIESLEEAVCSCLAKAPKGADESVLALSLDTTGSTPVPVDRNGTALALKENFQSDPNAMFILWKDHTALEEALQITEHAKNWGGTDFTKYSGGSYSSEWFWAKILHVLRIDEKVRNEAFSWVEHSDWLPGVLTGNTNPLTLKRSRCTAGHKAMWHAEWGGLPPKEFWAGVDPLLSEMNERLYTETFTADAKAGDLTHEWAQRLGLPAGISVGVGAIDAHMGAVGARIKPGTLSKIMGTSTCDMAVVSNEDLGDKTIDGICGQVDGSILPGLTGLEAGQAAFGDLYAWFRDFLSWPLENILPENSQLPQRHKENIIRQASDNILQRLGEAAKKIPINNYDPVAVDWINGRRTPDADETLKLALCGVSMGSDAPRLYRTLVEATAFGSRRIIERLEENNVEIKQIVASGGIAGKSPFVMQTCSDVIGKSINVVESSQCCALGAAIFASVICGKYQTASEAQEKIGSKISTTYHPDPERKKIYSQRYKQYLQVGEYAKDFSKRGFGSGARP